METPEKDPAPATGETPPTTDAAPEAPTTDAPAATPDEGGLGEAGKKALEAERRARREAEKAAAAAAAKVKEYEDAQKSEAEKAAERLAEAEKKAARADRLEVALDKGLPKALAERLRGDTREELEADADALLSLVKPAAEERDAPPAGSLDGGPRQPQPKKSLDEQIVEATAAGQWDVVNALNAQKLAQLAAKG